MSFQLPPKALWWVLPQAVTAVLTSGGEKVSEKRIHLPLFTPDLIVQTASGGAFRLSLKILQYHVIAYNFDTLLQLQTVEINCQKDQLHRVLCRPTL